MRSTFFTKTRRWIGASALAIIIGSGGLAAYITTSQQAAAEQQPVSAHLQQAAQITPPQATASNGFADLVDAVQSHRAVSARIAAYEYVSQRRWNLILNDGVVVKLPERGWQAQIDALERLIIDKGILERDISEIDLRSTTHYFFVLRGGARRDVERGKET